jgi:hypothetical protein
VFKQRGEPITVTITRQPLGSYWTLYGITDDGREVMWVDAAYYAKEGHLVFTPPSPDPVVPPPARTTPEELAAIKALYERIDEDPEGGPMTVEALPYEVSVGDQVVFNDDLFDIVGFMKDDESGDVELVLRDDGSFCCPIPWNQLYVAGTGDGRIGRAGVRYFKFV